MCLIAYAPNKSLISLESLKNAYENNKDGWGICYQDKTEKELVINKQLLDFEEFKKAWAEVPENTHVGVHFRWRTHGDHSIDNVHPYIILDKANGDPVDLVLMHNGVISYIHATGDKRSDTQMYVDLVLRPILKENWKLVYNESFKFIIERDISTGSKFLILPSEGDPIIYNKKSGHEEKDQPNVWYSNSYSIKTSTWRSEKTSTYSYNSSHVPSASSYQNDWWKRNQTEEAYTEYTFPSNLTPKEEEKKNEILSLLKPTEKIIDRVVRNKKSILGYGWVFDTRYSSRALTYNAALATKLREFISAHTKRIEAEAKNKDTNISTNSAVIPIDKETEKRLNKENLKLFSRAETDEWVRNNPEDACEYLKDAGFTGGSDAILDWIKNHMDSASEQVYHYAHFGKLIDYNNNKSLFDYFDDSDRNFYYA